MTPLTGVALTLALLLVAPQPAARPGSSAPASTVSTLEALRAQPAVPSLAVIVLKDCAIVDRAAVGVRKLGDPTPVTLADQFHLGSCTKSMTASLAALLVEDGKIAWTTTIAEAERAERAAGGAEPARAAHAAAGRAVRRRLGPRRAALGRPSCGTRLPRRRRRDGASLAAVIDTMSSPTPTRRPHPHRRPRTPKRDHNARS